MKKTATTTVKLALINAQRYANEKNKEYSRLRMSKDSLRRLSGRERIHDTFVDELTEEFARIGWHFFVHTDTEFGILKAEKVNVWAKIGTTRVSDLIEETDSGNEDAADVEYERIFGINDGSSISEDE
ncbi:hypothetical protein AAKU67_004477 [Oxalobacteraceae bacterium GrIS 2.11]